MKNIMDFASSVNKFAELGNTLALSKAMAASRPVVMSSAIEAALEACKPYHSIRASMPLMALKEKIHPSWTNLLPMTAMKFEIVPSESIPEMHSMKNWNNIGQMLNVGSSLARTVDMFNSYSKNMPFDNLGPIVQGKFVFNDSIEKILRTFHRGDDILKMNHFATAAQKIINSHTAYTQAQHLNNEQTEIHETISTHINTLFDTIATDGIDTPSFEKLFNAFIDYFHSIKQKVETDKKLSTITWLVGMVIAFITFIQPLLLTESKIHNTIINNINTTSPNFIANTNVKVRMKATINSKQVGLIEEGETVFVVKEHIKWMKIHFNVNDSILKEGWVRKEYFIK